MVNNLNSQNLEIAAAYYGAIQEGRKEELSSFYHPDVEFMSPLGGFSGADSVAEAASGFSDSIIMLDFRAKMADLDKVMLACDVFFKGSNAPLRTAILLEFVEEKIRKIECFYDGSQVAEADSQKIFQ